MSWVGLNTSASQHHTLSLVQNARVKDVCPLLPSLAPSLANPHLSVQ